MARTRTSFKKGQPKSSGRKKGTANKTTLDVRGRIEKLADPVGFWIQVARGEMFKRGAPNNPLVQTDWYPTLEQSMVAHGKLFDRVAPVMKAFEVSGPEGGDIIVKVVRFGDGN